MESARESSDQALIDSIKILAESANRTGRYAKLAVKVHQLAERRLDELTPSDIQCKAGCSFCCHRIVGCTLPEAIAVAEHVAQTWTEVRREALVERIQGYAGSMVEYLGCRTGRFEATCPFLEDDLCSIYDFRPLSCRAFTSSDVQACKRWSEGQGDPPVHQPPATLGREMDQAVIRGTYDGPLASGVFELASTVGCLLTEGTVACERRGITAPIERFALKSALNNGQYQPSETFGKLFKTPGFPDIWEACFSGDLETVHTLVPRFQDEAISRLTAMCLPSLYESQDELEENWARLDGAITDFENARLDPSDAYEKLGLMHTFYWAYAGKDVRPRLERVARKIHHEIAGRAFPQLCEPVLQPRRPGRFRLGYISRNLYNHSGSSWAVGWLKHHDPSIETFVFNTGRTEDDLTNLWRRLADHYFHLPIPALVIASLIRGLDLDALIFTDLSMGRSDSQLTCFRLARRQLTAWGHPVTSGSQTIDYYLSSELMEPSDGDDHYTEHLVRLPGSGLYIPRIVDPPEPIDPRSLGLPSNGFYFNAQMPSKNVPEHDRLFKQICDATGKPIAFLEPLRESDRPRLERRLRAAGINFVIVPRLPRRQFLNLLSRTDAVLDPPAWHGGNTTLDALAMGTPVVALPTKFMRGRHDLAFLTQAGVPGLVAGNEEEFVRLAVSGERIETARQGIRPDALFEDKTPIEHLDRLLLNP